MENETFLARASLAGYIVLSGVWFVLGGFYAWLGFARPASSSWRGSVICFAVGALWVVWLRGFRLRIEGDMLAYRDGMYRTYSGSVSHITMVQNTWIEWARLSRKIRIPRLLIEFEGGYSITINTKPFDRLALAAFRSKVESARSRVRAANDC